MSSPGRVSRKVAQAWLDEQSDLPIGRELRMHTYDEAVKGRLFSVRYFARPLKTNLCLVEFYIHDDGTVNVTNDQRDEARKAGEMTESRFFAALSDRTAETPDWFIGITKTRKFMDRRGIDAFAFVGYKEGERRLRVPIQIKSSWGGARAYRERHLLCSEHGVVVIVINPRKTDEQLRRYVYNELGRARNQKIKDGTRFTELHTLLGQGHR
jgi:hypothetical protein